MELKHGGDWKSFLDSTNEMPLDFSASISPLGLPDGVRDAATASLDRADLYPDPLCRDLVSELARHHNVNSECIIAGCGASDIIERLLKAADPDRVLVTAPAFSGYTDALYGMGCTVSKYPLSEDNGFRIKEDILGYITDDTDILFLCEPNNPTGGCTEMHIMESILERCRETGTILALDECFNDFLDDGEERSLTGRLDACRLVVIRAFTKFYAMPGLRLGYAMSGDTDLIEKMRQASQPWSVSVVAEAAGRAALKETEYAARLKKLIKSERTRMKKELSSLGFRSVQGDANFIFFYSDVRDLDERLRKKSVLIRDCSNFDGLEKGWFRAAVRTVEENDKLLRALRGALND